MSLGFVAPKVHLGKQCWRAEQLLSSPPELRLEHSYISLQKALRVPLFSLESSNVTNPAAISES